jgi:phosphatidylserine/phosphatidylglycerophosphate/cardiolipin synthase-like enzyme
VGVAGGGGAALRGAVRGAAGPSELSPVTPSYDRRAVTEHPTDPEDWFLRADERGNPDTAIDRSHAGGRAYTDGNLAVPLVHGAEYFARLLAAFEGLGDGDFVLLTDWRGDGDERLGAGEGTELAHVLAGLARRGVGVRGLVWRSHPDQARLSEQEAIELAEVVNEAGGELLLDERVRRGGSHHQKLVLARHPGREQDDVGFVGGVDLCHGRRDDERHHGDPQPIDLDRRYGDRPPWHDIQLELRGPALGDVADTFRERWEDPTPLDRPGRPRAPPPGPAATPARRPRARRTPRRAGLAHLPGQAPALPVRPRR